MQLDWSGIRHPAPNQKAGVGESGIMCDTWAVPTLMRSTGVSDQRVARIANFPEPVTVLPVVRVGLFS